jgi:hypothetical protein
MAYEFDQALLNNYPGPGATPAEAPLIQFGGSVSNVAYTGFDETDTYKTYNTDDWHMGNVGWYRVKANGTGMARVSSNYGMIQVYKVDDDGTWDLAGARQNGGSIYLFCDFESGYTYYLRFCAYQPTLNMALSKISPVVHVFQQFTNPRLSTDGVHGSLSGAGLASFTLDWEDEYDSSSHRYNYAKNLWVDLPAIPVPTSGIVDSSVNGIADIRYVIHGTSIASQGGVPTSTGPAFLFQSSNGSYSTYWTHDWLWNWQVQRERWISLRSFNSSFIVDPTSLINGTLKGTSEAPNYETLAVGRVLRGIEGEWTVNDLRWTGVRMSWFAPNPETSIEPGALNTRQHFFEGRD